MYEWALIFILSRIRQNFQTGTTATGGADPRVFNMGAQIFGHVLAETNKAKSLISVDQDEVGSDDSDDIEADSEKSLLTALASVTIAESPWRSAPSYPPLYLSTVGEYLAPQAKPRVPQEAQVSGLGEDEMKDKSMNWATETYENSLEIDHVFERFTKRVGYEGEQCVRSGTNLS